MDVGQKSETILSPKLGIAYSLTDAIELYGNWGRGFRSNDARGVVKITDPVPGLVRGAGYEGGARFEVGTFKVSVAYWWLNLSSELIFVGDDNTVEPKGGASRRGYEVVAFWRPMDWLGIDFVYAGSRARYDNEQDGGGRYVEGGVEGAGELGIAATKGDWELSARLRYLGEYPLLPDNSERADAEVMLNLRAGHTWGKVTLYGEVLNVLDANGKDIVYFFDAFDPTGGRVSRAEEPRSLRFGVHPFFNGMGGRGWHLPCCFLPRVTQVRPLQRPRDTLRRREHLRRQRTEMLLDQRLDIVPVEAAHPRGKARQREAAPLFGHGQLSQRLQRMAHVLHRCGSGAPTGRCRRGLREQVDDDLAVRAHPCPDAAGFGTVRLFVVAKILVHGRPLFRAAPARGPGGNRR